MGQWWPGQSGAVRTAGLVAATAVLLGASRSDAHDWYPFECCNEKDCSVVTQIEHRTLGRYSVMTSSHGRVTVPDSFPRRASPDNQTHLCVLETPVGPVPRCLFVPGLPGTS